MRRHLSSAAAAILYLLWAEQTLRAEVSYEIVADLSSISGAVPLAGLIRGADGALYGTTNEGGTAGCGTVYRLTLDGALTVVHNFVRPEGCNPVGDLAIGSDEAFYGTTYFGGDGLGTIYKVTASGEFRMLRSFAGSPGGSQPYAGLTLGPDGWLYGTTTQGSVAGGGVIFRISNDGVYEILRNGMAVQAALTLGADGAFYGTTYAFSSTSHTWGHVFRFALDGTLTALHAFPAVGDTLACPCPDGAQLVGEVLMGPDGRLYGTTSIEGPNPGDAGTVFRLALDGTLETIHSFAPDSGGGMYSQGQHPWTGLTLGTDGYSYGFATGGGTGLNGTIYRLAPDGDNFTTLRHFDGVDGGSSQEGRLLEVAPGVFYGTTAGGKVFRLTVDTPDAHDGSFTTDEDKLLTGTLTATGSGTGFTFSIDDNGRLGTADITDAASGAFTFTPHLNAFGTDRFTFKASDGTFTSGIATATVTINAVNDSPEAFDGTLTTDAGTPMTATLEATDIDGPALTFSIVSNANRGLVALIQATTGTYTYTPHPNESGSDSFTFTASDGIATSNLATIMVTVRPVAKASQSLTFQPIADHTLGDAPFSVNAAASSGLPVTLSVQQPGLACTLTSNVVTLTGAGACTLVASQAGNDYHLPASPVTRTFSVFHSWTGVLAPLSPDSITVVKRGSTVPVKFRLTGAGATVTNLAARIHAVKMSSAVAIGEEVELAPHQADAGNVFRYDAAEGQYIFNWGTKGLAEGTWRIRIDLLDGNSDRTAMVVIKK